MVILPEFNQKTGAGTVWNIAIDDLRANGNHTPTPEDIIARTGAILKANGWTWKKAHDLPNGIHVKIPAMKAPTSG